MRPKLWGFKTWRAKKVHVIWVEINNKNIKPSKDMPTVEKMGRVETDGNDGHKEDVKIIKATVKMWRLLLRIDSFLMNVFSNKIPIILSFEILFIPMFVSNTKHNLLTNDFVYKKQKQ